MKSEKMNDGIEELKETWGQLQLQLKLHVVAIIAIASLINQIASNPVCT